MRLQFFLVFWLIAIPAARTQQMADRPIVPGKDHNFLVSAVRTPIFEAGAAARDLATFRDSKWELLTLTQIGAAAADIQTSLSNMRHCPVCEETGIPRWVVGRHPDGHKYAVAGVFEIGAEAVLGHYLRNRSPRWKWYWRYAWILPQGFSAFEHTRADFHNAGIW